MNGFDVDALVARGVFASREEYDRVMCALEEERPTARVVAKSWSAGMAFTVPVQPTNFEAGAVVSSAGLPMPHLLGDRPASSYPLEICAWCALEHVLQGHGSAPRSNGDIAWVSCERHSSPAPASRPDRTTGRTPATPGAANAAPHASVPGLPLPPCAEPFHPTLNPNAGVPLAFPKGRWS